MEIDEEVGADPFTPVVERLTCDNPARLERLRAPRARNGNIGVSIYPGRSVECAKDGVEMVRRWNGEMCRVNGHGGGATAVGNRSVIAHWLGERARAELIRGYLVHSYLLRQRGQG